MRDYKPCFCALMLLGALAGCGRGVDPSVVDPYDALREKLKQTVTVDWDDVPLETALRELTEQHGLALTVDMAALGTEWAPFVVERDLGAALTLHLRDVRLR